MGHVKGQKGGNELSPLQLLVYSSPGDVGGIGKGRRFSRSSPGEYRMVLSHALCRETRVTFEQTSWSISE